MEVLPRRRLADIRQDFDQPEGPKVGACGKRYPPRPIPEGRADLHPKKVKNLDHGAPSVKYVN